MKSGKARIRTTRWTAVACSAGAIASAFLTVSVSAGDRQFLVMLAASPKEYNLPCKPDPDDPRDPWCPERPYTYECTVLGPTSPEAIEWGICVTPCATDQDCEQVSEAEEMTFVCSHLFGYPGHCVPDYPTPEEIRKQYFDEVDSSIGSFAEYWEEISYGDVTISGTVTDWINLPWRINPPRELPRPQPDFPEDPEGAGGVGSEEMFLNFRAMVMVDINGDPLGIDDGPFSPAQNPAYAQGGQDFHRQTGLPIWMPGERFIDMDADGRWDGLDEANNNMDWDGDGRPDLAGPWVDLNEDGLAEQLAACLYLGDSDNDGLPDCCPDGPGETGCEAFPTPGACRATEWPGPGGVDIVDCNGNLIPDACDIDCLSLACFQSGWIQIICPGGFCDHDTTGRCVGGSRHREPCSHLCGNSADEHPYDLPPEGTGCAPGPADGIPDECQFEVYTRGAPCAEDGTEVGDCGQECGDLGDARAPVRRCEYVDVNLNRVLDIVEPFENFMRRWDETAWVPVSESYIRANYPGDVDKVIARGETRLVYVSMDTPGTGECPTNVPCQTDAGCAQVIGIDPACDTSTRTCYTQMQNVLAPNGSFIFNACPVGEHAAYDPPDYWEDEGSTKMEKRGRFVGFTLRPPWLHQVWQEWFGTDPPAWDPVVMEVGFFVPLEVEGDDSDRFMRKSFSASHGGLHGDGSGWIGCDDAIDRGVEFQVFRIGISPFEEACNSQILPEELDGIGVPLIFYDGPPEFTDMPSSKYHQTGDGRLGEVTSPFLNHIWGEDLGDGDPGSGAPPDGWITAAGPFATKVHGNFGYDAGNVLSLELLTWRDWTLDGMIDQGDITRPGRESYREEGNRRLVEDCIEILDDVIDFDDFTDSSTLDHVGGPSAFATMVPPVFQPHDVIQPKGVCSGIVLLPPNIYTCSRLGRLVDRCAFHQPPPYYVISPTLFPIHNEDGLDDPYSIDSTFPEQDPQLSWNLLFHDLVTGIDIDSCSLTIPPDNYQTAYAAHKWLHAWEKFADMYDYGVYQPGSIENCPVGLWDIMADGGLVHPAPIMKELSGTKWIIPVDLKSVVTPGVDARLTLPPAEFQRDKSYYFLENQERPGERYYFWSAGRGFDERLPGEGMLIMHTDLTPRCETDEDCPEGFPCVSGLCEGAVSNPDAPPPQQWTGTRPTYMIVQADGEGELEACDDRGDPGDPWPGSTEATRFNFDTTPPARWYAPNSWTGLDVLDIVPDGAGSLQLNLNWVPTNLPSLRFIDPPGGESVGTTYTVTFEATDVYGGTRIRLYYMDDEKVCSDTAASCTDDSGCPPGEFCAHKPVILGNNANLIGNEIRKGLPTTKQLDIGWDISDVHDGRYVLFAKLTPGVGSDGEEIAWTPPRPGRNNVGKGSLVVDNVDPDAVRSETWTAVCIDSDFPHEWRVNSSLTQPVLNEDDPDSDPYPKAETGETYESIGGEVRFTIEAGTCDENSNNAGEPCSDDADCPPAEGRCRISAQFVKDDAFTFTTTGITAVSRSLAIIDGQIKEDPTAVISASPLACPAPSEDLPPCPPLTVTFDGRGSYDPNGESLEYRWDFGDGSDPVSGSQVQNTFYEAGTFTVVLLVTNPNNERSGEAAVDIEVTNNSPQAVVIASPTSGRAPLEVLFSGAQSSDIETAPDQLTYYWSFGDGQTANSALVPGSAFQSINHLFINRADGTPCTEEAPCSFNTTLTVIDEGDKKGTDTVTIRVGNTDPVPVITHTPLEGPDPWPVVFNAINSFDADGDELCVKWEWSEGEFEVFPDTGPDGVTDGRVEHTYYLPGDDTSASFSTRAVVYDDRCLSEDEPCEDLKDKLAVDPDWDDPRCGKVEWGPVTVTVSEATVGDSDPRAIFTIDPPQPQLGEEFTVDASLSYDLPYGHVITSYTWAWDDGTQATSGREAKHTYTVPGSYLITLTVEDDEDPPNTNSSSQLVVISTDEPVEPPEDNQPPIALFTVNPPSGVAGVTEFTFNASASSDPDGDDTKLTYLWSFGDGSPTETGAVVSHVYAQPKVNGYVVRLTVRDEDNASTEATQEVIVKGAEGNQPPHAYIATGPRTGTAPVALSFDGRNSFDPDGDSLQFRWEFSSGGVLIDTLIGPQVTRLFNESGTYAVELEVSDGRGLSDRAGPQTIVIAAPTEPPPQPPGPTEPEPPQEIPDSADQRPLGRMCGPGMIGSLFASLLGLTAIRATCRRRRL
ncbi:MAG: PKD domain-containing protein [Phycisphaerales bacterium]|nr:MAG: PKD domain-containing protein [Phycisphaerales bacterium]